MLLASTALLVSSFATSFFFAPPCWDDYSNDCEYGAAFGSYECTEGQMYETDDCEEFAFTVPGGVEDGIYDSCSSSHTSGMGDCEDDYFNDYYACF